jgi:hypothetical protein
MAEPNVNEGVMIGGNATVSGPVAGGRFARAEQTNVSGGETARRELAFVRDLVQRHRDQVDDVDLVEDDIQELDRELGRPGRDRDRVVALVRRIANRVAAVGVLAAAVQKLREIVAG